MHQYLPSIGFSKVNSRALEWNLLDSLIGSADETVSFKLEGGVELLVHKKYVADDCGISLVGLKKGEEFRLERYFPFIRSDVCTSRLACTFSRMSSEDTVIASMDDSRFGVTTIFHLINQEDFYVKRLPVEEAVSVKGSYLTGLAIKGSILLPVEKTQEQEQAASLRNKKRARLLDEARMGREDAMEELNDQEMETISVVNQRIFQDDIYSVVDSFFMPYGVECEQYMLMGEIQTVKRLKNSFTGEDFYKLTVKANDISVAVGINAQELVGYPEPGRRIKCEVWLQGYVDFS